MATQHEYDFPFTGDPSAALADAMDCARRSARPVRVFPLYAPSAFVMVELSSPSYNGRGRSLRFYRNNDGKAVAIARAKVADYLTECARQAR